MFHVYAMKLMRHSLINTSPHRIDYNSPNLQIDLSDITPNREWEVTGTSFKKRVRYYSSVPDVPFPDVLLSIGLQRKSNSHTACIVVPGLGTVQTCQAQETLFVSRRCLSMNFFHSYCSRSFNCLLATTWIHRAHLHFTHDNSHQCSLPILYL